MLIWIIAIVALVLLVYILNNALVAHDEKIEAKEFERHISGAMKILKDNK